MSKTNLTDYLCCSVCKGNLVEVDEILKCLECGNTYSFVDEIPIMVDLENLPAHLKHQVQYFENSDLASSGTYVFTPWQEAYLTRFKTNFSNISKKLVVDCGTGSGYMAVELAKEGAIVIATDLTLKSLLRLKSIKNELGLENLILVCCTAEELPIKDNIADYYISNAVFEHLPKEIEAIQETNRITKSGAGLMVTVPLKFRYLNPFLMPVNFIHDKRIGHLRRYNEDTLKENFSGWKHLSTYYTGHIQKVLKCIVNMFSQVFDEHSIEEEDKVHEKKISGASNIICFFQKA